VAFLRFSRDKRGYEHFSLVQPTTNRRGATRQRVLYMYRTPPDVKVGREPFDEAVRRALEAQYPDVGFDWRKILETPIPSADAERWRERRRADRAARQAASVEAAGEEVADAEATEDLDLPTVPQPAASIEPLASTADADPAGSQLLTSASSATTPTPAPAGDVARKRRRRRRGRRGRPEGAAATSAGSTGQAPDAAAAAPGDGQAAIAEQPHEPEPALAFIEPPGE
jgi:hypothetical protein